MFSVFYSRITVLVFAVLVTSSSTAVAAPILLDANFDQIAKVNALGGTVTQIGGTAPGKDLVTSADFEGNVSGLTGVAVSLPAAVFAINAQTAAGNNEPGNDTPVLLGPPTDLTFTAPGPGGPDGTDGDGAFKLNPGQLATFTFGEILGAESLLIFTNTANGGTAWVEFLLNGILEDSIDAFVASNTPGSGIGGIEIDLNGLAFNSVRITALNGSLELDAIAAYEATVVPEPGSILFFGTGLLGLGMMLLKKRVAVRTGKADQTDLREGSLRSKPVDNDLACGRSIPSRAMIS